MLRPLRHRDFGLLWVGQAVSLIGDGIYLVAIAWLVYDLWNAPGALALWASPGHCRRWRPCSSRAC